MNRDDDGGYRVREGLSMGNKIDSIFSLHLSEIYSHA